MINYRHEICICIYVCIYTEIDPLLTHEQLMSFLTFPSVASKWYNIGVFLCVPPPQLDDISMLFQDNVTCMSETFREWMMRKTVPFTWEVLLQALRSETVEEYELAHHLQIHLQQIYRRQSSQPSTPLSSQGILRYAPDIHIPSCYSTNAPTELMSG